ncbi:hypothetical protein L596_011574 [Steinernema carpocapsae]|uniref:Uncharacterized protein n=1 Tax=Steinernema carpocapsae TaxID=34508 RepID=A0A4U5NUC6_STECR|nr:hypothetical protein L596_011574 [Steinernema carpocapsae]
MTPAGLDLNTRYGIQKKMLRCSWFPMWRSPEISKAAYLKLRDRELHYWTNWVESKNEVILLKIQEALKRTNEAKNIYLCLHVYFLDDFKENSGTDSNSVMPRFKHLLEDLLCHLKFPVLETKPYPRSTTNFAPALYDLSRTSEKWPVKKFVLETDGEVILSKLVRASWKEELQ